MATIEFQIKTSLQLLNSYETVDRGELSMKRVGEKTIQTLLDNGWAEESQSLSGKTLYSITELGREKLREPAPPKPPKRKPLTSLPPRIKTLDPMDRFRKK
jgi:DNA-binding PadR family transcriptional regulator